MGPGCVSRAAFFAALREILPKSAAARNYNRKMGFFPESRLGAPHFGETFMFYAGAVLRVFPVSVFYGLSGNCRTI